MATEKQISAVMAHFGRLGGLIGGVNRAARLTAEQRKEIASKAGSAPKKPRSDKGKKRGPRKAKK